MRNANDEVRRYWWNRSWESLEAAKRDFQAEAYSFAINRLYYAAFYAVSALLVKEHYPFSKHSGVRAAFHKHFVKTERIEDEWGKLYDRLFEDRHEGDYVEFVTFDKAYVQDQIRQTELFLNRLKSLVENMSL